MSFEVDTAAFHITYVCEHNCPMCYVSENRKKGIEVDHPCLEQVISVIDELAKNGVKNISFVGGDPARYPHLYELCVHANSLGLNLSILSNTLDFGEKHDEIMSYIGCFEGTIHSSVPSRHDAFCEMEGAYRLLTDNLRICSKNKKEVGLTLNITPYTYNELYDIVLNVKQLGVGVRRVTFQRIVPFGGAYNCTDYEITKEQLAIALSDVARIENELNVKVFFEDPFPVCAVDTKYHKYMHPCEWGINKVAVDYDGRLSRCGADPRCSLGNLFEQNLRELWATSDELKCFRERNFSANTHCRTCQHAEQCGGACPISKDPDIGFSRDYLSQGGK